MKFRERQVVVAPLTPIVSNFSLKVAGFTPGLEHMNNF